VVLSGLWLYWVHVGAVSQLGSTLYGRTLLVKAATPKALPRSAPPRIGASFYLWAAAEGLVVVGVLLGTARLGRSRAREQRVLLDLRASPVDEPAISNA
jgi:hypothetical protein